MHIVVYAGPVKSASSTVQKVLWLNRDALRTAGIEYMRTDAPDGWFEWSLVTLYGYPATFPRTTLFPTREAQLAWSAGAWEDFEAKIDRSTADVVLISSEFFSTVKDKEAMIARLRQRAERVSFIAYARDPVELYTSGIDEAARGGESFAELPDPADFRYPMQGLGGFGPLLGRGEFVIRSFERNTLAGGDIVTDFFQVLSKITGREVAPTVHIPRENESLCGAASLWLLLTNAISPVEGEAVRRRIRLFDALRRDETLKGLPRLRMTDPDIAEAIRISNRNTIGWLNAGPLAYSPLKTAPPDAEIPPAPQMREKLETWYLSYGRAEHMRLVMEAAMRHGHRPQG